MKCCGVRTGDAVCLLNWLLVFLFVLSCVLQLSEVSLALQISVHSVALMCQTLLLVFWSVTDVCFFPALGRSHGVSFRTFRNFTHTVYLWCFVWIPEQTAIISLYSINWLVFITETECVYCAVRTLYIKQICFVFKGLKSLSASQRPSRWQIPVARSCSVTTLDARADTRSSQPANSSARHIRFASCSE
jgi:hypothetical protein